MFPRLPGALPFPLRPLTSDKNDGQPAPQLRSPLIFNAPIAGRISCPDYIPNLLVCLLISTPPGMQRSEAAPAIKAPVVAEQYVNYVLYGIPANLPVGEYLPGAIRSQGDPIVKYQVVAEQYINNTVNPIPAGISPAHTQLTLSAPPNKFEVRADQFTNELLLGITAQYTNILLPGQRAINAAAQYNAPEIKYQLRIDPVPNLLGRELVQSTSRPFVGLVEPELPTVRPYTTADLFVVTYIPTTTLGIPTRPPLVMPTPAPKTQVFATQTPNTLILGITAQHTTQPFLSYVDTSALQSKLPVYDVNYLHQALAVVGPPFVAQFPFRDYTFNPRQTHFDVYDLNLLWPNSQLPNTIPPPFTPPPPLAIEGLSRPGGRVILNPKKLGETVPENFNFLSALGQGETLVSAVTTCSVFTGVDPNPTAVLDGATTVAGTVATQGVTGGVIGVVYELLCTGKTNLANVIEISAFLAIEPDVPG